MKTTVIMQRKLFDGEISQNSKTGYFSATDLQKAGNKYRMLNGLTAFNMNKWISTDATTAFIKRLEKDYGKVKISARGRGHHTWIHPYLFIDMALAISPDLKIEVYSWIMDELVKRRNSSGDSYKKMSGALYINQVNKREYPFYITSVAHKIKLACNVNNWETATEEELELRDKIHNNISLLCDVLKNNDQAVKIAILKAVNCG